MTIEADVVLDGAEILGRVRALAPLIETAAEQIEAERRLPAELVTALKNAGVFRMPMPLAWGGPEIDPLTQVRVLAELASHDGATGWVSMICCDGGYYTSHLDDEVGRALYPDLDLLTAGHLAPSGAATGRPEHDGYRVTGRWQFGSGILHSDRIVGGFIVMDGDHPALDPDGRPVWRVAFLPKEQVAIHDTWFTTGLRGTSSNDYSVDDVFVPAEHTFSPFTTPRREGTLYRYSFFTFAKVAAVALGLLRRGIDETVALAQTKATPPAFQPIKHEYRVQVAVASACADLNAAWGLVERTYTDVWATLARGEELSTEQRASFGSSPTWVVRTAKRAIDDLCDEAGTASAFASQRLERVRRDITQISHHILGQRKILQVAGQHLLGVPPLFAIF